MAILRDQPGLKVEILVDGSPLREYDDDDEEIVPTVVTKYIEAKSGVNFTIRYTILPQFHIKHALVVRSYLDGKSMESHVCSEDVLRKCTSSTMTGVREAIAGKYYERKFCFSQLNTDDSDPRGAVASLKKNVESLGEISLRFRWVKISGQPVDATSRDYSDFRTIDTISEKALKGRAISHQASLQARTDSCSFKTVTTTNVYDDQIFATYRFKYRSKNALRALCILPRTPSPVPLEERDVDQLSPEEMRELLKGQRERDRAAKIVKRERERSRDRIMTCVGDGDDDNDEVSFVSSTKRRKLPSSTINEVGIETFDLT